MSIAPRIHTTTQQAPVTAVAVRRPLRRRLVLPLLAAAVALSTVLSVQPGTAWAHAAELGSRQFTYGDCTLTVGMRYWTHEAWANAYGQASCRSVKRHTRVTLTLKKNGGTEQVAAATTFFNSYGMGSRWLFARWMRGCTFQAVMHVDIAGYRPTYVTSGAPVGICQRSVRTRTGHAKDGRAPSAGTSPVAIARG